MSDIKCYCNSGLLFSEYCQPYILGVKKAPTAETLMRSRYSAYAIHDADHLWQTTAPKERRYHSKPDMLQWAKSNQWIKLEILKATDFTVEFKAYYLDYRLKAQVHHEKSFFMMENDNWYYEKGVYPEYK